MMVTMQQVGQVYSDCIPILTPNVADDSVIHNVIRVCPYTGIVIGRSWDDSNQGMSNNIIQYNLIHDVMQLHDDGAAIYTLGGMPNGLFFDNYIYAIASSPFNGGYAYDAIYLDNGSCYTASISCASLSEKVVEPRNSTRAGMLCVACLAKSD